MDREFPVVSFVSGVWTLRFMQLDIPARAFAGYIFDLDGTLIDSMPLHYKAWDKAMTHFGLRESLDEDLFYSLGGVPTVRVAELLGEHYKIRLNPLEVLHVKENFFVELQPEMKLIEPVVAFARQVAKTHPVAIASGGTRDLVEGSLKITGLAPLFPVVVTATDVIHGKPSPDMFLLAAKRMGVEPKDCLVFEDAVPGMLAAEAAGMGLVKVPSRVL